MCGITGYITRSAEPETQLQHHTRLMCDAIVHRGPDDMGLWSDAAAGVTLGHRRLSIVDLSPAGHQPMTSICGRYTLVFNGEIYNHLELREECSGVVWRGHSDTETILACMTKWGFAATLTRLVGMFAIAAWDRADQCLLLARDRMGEKPLFYGRVPSGDFLFGSELKALRAHPRWIGEIDRDALAQYMRHNAVPAPRSIYKDIYKLEPGIWMTVHPDGRVRKHRYWDLRTIADSARSGRPRLTDEQAIDKLDSLLGRAVKDQMVADVPLGAFLSGGVDSSTIVALMCSRSISPVQTFSIGFEQAGFNEAVHAKAVAQHLGTSHTELYVDAQDALNVIPQLGRMYDEPFADSSQIPTFLVAQMARKHVTVSLSGDAGDELFAGYNRYVLAERVWQKLDRFPLWARKAAASSALSVSPGMWDRIAATLGIVAPVVSQYPNPGDKLHKFASHVLAAASPEAMYRALVSHWQEPSSIVLGSTEPKSLLDEVSFSNDAHPAVEQMCLLDQLTYLPDDILTKVDRAAMAVSLETRIPLLDHRVVEFAWQTPMHQKIRNGQTKWLLRQVLYRYVPRELIERPKQGFAVPLDQWLRGPLRDWADSLLDERRLRQQGLLNVQAVREKWLEHLRGTRNWQYLLWDVLMLQAWIEAN